MVHPELLCFVSRCGEHDCFIINPVITVQDPAMARARKVGHPWRVEVAIQIDDQVAPFGGGLDLFFWIVNHACSRDGKVIHWE